MTPAYTLKLDLRVHPTNVEAQKIDGSTLKTSRVVLAIFQIDDKLKRARFFQETFLLTNISMEIVLGKLFLTFSNAYV